MTGSSTGNNARVKKKSDIAKRGIPKISSGCKIHNSKAFNSSLNKISDLMNGLDLNNGDSSNTQAVKKMRTSPSAKRLEASLAKTNELVTVSTSMESINGFVQMVDQRRMSGKDERCGEEKNNEEYNGVWF